MELAFDAGVPVPNGEKGALLNFRKLTLCIMRPGNDLAMAQ